MLDFWALNVSSSRHFEVGTSLSSNALWCTCRNRKAHCNPTLWQQSLNMGNVGYRQTFEPNKCQHPIGYCCFTDIFVPPNTLFFLAILHFHLDLDLRAATTSWLEEQSYWLQEFSGNIWLLCLFDDTVFHGRILLHLMVKHM